ncbi:MAG: bifunctional nicotinamidase/pyrazinamidase [Desulfomonilaceae bacterium]|nr:bifunctional nicotinamidase/pyrazinamidase [Desulfomonilaceae bacterium]
MNRPIILMLAVTLCAISMPAGAPSVWAQQEIGVIVVDLQGDFTTLNNGSLAVEGTDKAYVDKVAKATEALKNKGYPVFATQDWHPEDHISFYTNHPGKKPFEAIKIDERTQVLWPPHCIQGTDNAKILLDNGLFAAVVKKGRDKNFDSYSGFKDDGGAKTELDKVLKEKGIRELIIYGLATDYCVKATAVDAADAGYKVTVIEDLCRGVAPETTAKALKEMKEKGITIKKDLES